MNPVKVSLKKFCWKLIWLFGKGSSFEYIVLLQILLNCLFHSGAGSTNVSPSALVLNRFSSDKVPSFHNTFISLCNGNLCPSFGNSSFYLLPTLLVAIGFGRIRSAADLQVVTFNEVWSKSFSLVNTDLRFELI